MLKLSEIVKIVENGQNCQKLSTNCQKLSKLSKIVQIVKTLKHCQKCWNSQKSVTESVSESVTRSPIELLWTAKKGSKLVIFGLCSSIYNLQIKEKYGTAMRHCFNEMTATMKIPESRYIWDTDYNSDNWEPEFMKSLWPDLTLRVSLDNICNSHVPSPNPPWFCGCKECCGLCNIFGLTKVTQRSSNRFLCQPGATLW